MTAPAGKPATKTQAASIVPGALQGQATEWQSLHDRLVANLDLAQRDYAGSGSYWTGKAGDRARESASTTVTEGRKITSALAAAVAAANTGQSDIATSKATAVAAIELAEQAKFKVAEDGTVTAPDARNSLPNAKTEDITAAQAALDATAKTTYEPPIKAALLGLGQTIESTTTAIEKAFENIGSVKTAVHNVHVSLGERSQQVQDILDGKSKVPTNSKDFKSFWDTLSNEEKDALWNQNHYIGNTDGMPATDRDHYNRLTLDERLTAAQAARAEAQQIFAAHPEWTPQVLSSGVPAESKADFERWLAKREESKHLEDLTTLKEVTGDKYPNSVLMQVDDKSGTNVHAVVADGNPDTASHVTTYVPGTGSEPSKMGKDMERVAAMTDSALDQGAKRPVTVAWFGYDAPPGLFNATQDSYAKNGASALTAFQDGLRVTHEGSPSANTVLGHSYGTTLIGEAASNGRTLNADNVVLVGSPGAGVDNVREISLSGVADGTQGQHIFATRAENDPVPRYSWANEAGVLIPIGGVLTDDHGINPTDSSFGGQVFTSDPGTAGPWWSGGYSTDAHSDYWNTNSTSLVNMGRIIAGKTAEVS
ncbi:alpha/beta hydrolase [Nocardia camponoti]|uniref:DUF1023 domain-containing protein n=1 Tax=Nocardia camponoti TaxID=1616106 RepID=A0A917VA11_9NOCA|nr:alpha/beta hydrolase [Nocardia camponoti]GGK53240.1 hypothetical protein GCM10011591_26290 [Nocardia camponoti]